MALVPGSVGKRQLPGTVERVDRKPWKYLWVKIMTEGSSETEERREDRIVRDPAGCKQGISHCLARNKRARGPPTPPKILLLRRRRVLRGKCTSTFIPIPYSLGSRGCIRERRCSPNGRQLDSLDFGNYARRRRARNRSRKSAFRKNRETKRTSCSFARTASPLDKFSFATVCLY